MRKIVLWMGVSLDGFIAGPDGDLSWHRVDDELLAHFNEDLGAMGGFIHGRVVYELMAAAWGDAESDPSMTPRMLEFAPIWREMPKIVFSRTLPSAGWNSTVVREVEPDQIRAWKAESGGDLSLGGADIGAAFLEHDLIDEFRIYVHPVIVGAGKPLFLAPSRSVDLRLIESRVFGNGVVLLRYERAA